MERRFGWIKQHTDLRDFTFKLTAPVECPPHIDHRNNCPEVYDQGSLGSCTANAIAGCYQFNQMQQGIEHWMPSRLFIYFNERLMEGTINSDAGATIRDGIKSVAKQGVCPESNHENIEYEDAFWPYSIEHFATRPPESCYTEALNHQAVTYAALPHGNIDYMRQVLASGEIFTFGFSVYSSFQSAEVKTTGIVPYPKPRERLLGGHAVVCIGYDDESKHFIVRNSWGTDWGDKGYCYMPYNYLGSKLASDFWVINTVE